MNRALLGDPVIVECRHVAAENVDVVGELGLEEIHAGGDLGVEAVGVESGAGIAGGVGRADQQARRRIDGPARRQASLVAQLPRHGDEAAAVGVLHRLRVGLISLGDAVAVETQDRGNAQRRRTDHVALDGEPVAVANRELQHRLDTVRRQDQPRRAGRTCGPWLRLRPSR